MKRLIQCFFALFCCFSLLLGSSVCVNAEELETRPYYISEWGYYIIGNSWTRADGDTWTYNNNDGMQMQTQHLIYINANQYYGSGQRNIHYWNVKYEDGSVMAMAGERTTIRLDNVYYSNLVEGSNFTFYDRNITAVGVTIKYVDGSTEEFTGTWEGKETDARKNLKVTFTPKKAVNGVEFWAQSSVSDEMKTNGIADGSAPFSLTTYYGEWFGDTSPILKITQPSEEAELITGFWESVTQGFSNLINGITNIFNKIGDIFTTLKNLPQQIWNVIKEGIEDLYIPDDEFLAQYVENWKALLSSTLGAVWEVAYEFTESWGVIQDCVASRTVSFPEVTIPLGSESFSFGGYDVQIVPSGFEFLADACKLAFGVTGTLAFVKGLRRKYDEIMGGK